VFLKICHRTTGKFDLIVILMFYSGKHYSVSQCNYKHSFFLLHTKFRNIKYLMISALISFAQGTKESIFCCPQIYYPVLDNKKSSYSYFFDI